MTPGDLRIAMIKERLQLPARQRAPALVEDDRYCGHAAACC